MSDYDYILWQEEANKVIFDDESLYTDNWIHPISANWEDYSRDNYDVEIDVTESSTSRVPLVEISDYNILVRMVGRLRNHFSQNSVRILFRGQRNHHNFVQFPSFLRNYVDSDRLGDYMIDVDWLHFFHVATRSRLSDSINLLAWEATLQHYGIKTRYLDVVDNLNKALWFSISDVRNRSVSQNDYSYLFVYGIQVQHTVANGVWDSDNLRLIDLRHANPPLSLRSHVQDSMLFCDKRILSIDFMTTEKLEKFGNYSKYLFCVVKIPTTTVKSWFGAGSFLYSFDSFFPVSDNLLRELQQWWRDFLDINGKLRPDSVDEFVRTFGSIS